MRIFTKTSELRQELSLERTRRKLGLVPTMGYLHEGHMSLLEMVKSRDALCLVTSFVNPLQFNNAEDLSKYPRDQERDIALLERAGTDILFLPEISEIYGNNFQSQIINQRLAEKWEGHYRPGHFQGVTTIVGILFNITKPDFAVFGEKDFQQLRIIEQMVSDLKFDMEIVRAPTVRDMDGLALSSRNSRLSPDGRKNALAISAGLLAGRQCFSQGEISAEKIKQVTRETTGATGNVRIEYLALVDAETLDEVEQAGSGSRLLIAAYVEGVRLIDNISLA